MKIYAFIYSASDFWKTLLHKKIQREVKQETK